MKFLLVLISILCYFTLYSQPVDVDSLASIQELEGDIMLDQNGNIVFIGHDISNYHIGDGYNGIFMTRYTTISYISFPIPSFLISTAVNRVDLYLKLYSCMGDNVLNSYPVFQLPTANVLPSFMLTHIDYGFSLDQYDVNSQVLHPSMVFVDLDSFSIGWHSIDITDYVRNDIQCHRVYSQYKLTLQYQNVLSDWDYYDDRIYAQSSCASIISENPYVKINYNTSDLCPVIEHTPLTTISNDMMPITFSSVVTDDTALNSVLLKYRIDDQDSVIVIMNSPDDINYVCSVDIELPVQGGYFYYKISAMDSDNHTTNLPASGWFDVIIEPTSANDNVNITPALKITSLYPNPFRISTGTELRTEFETKPGTKTKATVYNLKGQFIRHLGSSIASGKSACFVWNGRDEANHTIKPGIYLIKISQSGGFCIRKIIVLD